MPTIDASLDSIKIPAFENYDPPFNNPPIGTPVVRGPDIETGVSDNLGGLNIRQVNDNIVAPFVKMRPIQIFENTTLANIGYDAKVVIKAQSTIALTLNTPAYKGCKLTIINTTSDSHLLNAAGYYQNNFELIPNIIFQIVWNGTIWQNITAPGVGKTISQYPLEQSPELLYPCAGWLEITSKFQGAFFRTRGGNADPFIEADGTLTPQAQGTAVNGLKFTGTRAKSGKQSALGSVTESSSHTHSPLSYNGYRQSYSTTNSWYCIEQNDTGSIYNTNDSSTKITVSSVSTTVPDLTVTGNHTHTMTVKGKLTSTDTETRPINLAKRIWLRVG